jgi:hypothetical protein
VRTEEDDTEICQYSRMHHQHTVRSSVLLSFCPVLHLLFVIRWVGYIKDYDGGTLMECYIHPGMDYLNVPKIVAMQRAFIYERIKERTQ